jgi:hypothetical protein
MSDKPDVSNLLIWWTAQEDCQAIAGPDEDFEGPPLDTVPSYIRDEFESRYGRNGRGRLWVPDGIDLESIDFEANKDKRAAQYADEFSMGGIVFHRSDFAAIAGLPGFVTDVELNYARP